MFLFGKGYPLPASQTFPESELQVLLDLMNDIWETGDLPSIWKLEFSFFLLLFNFLKFGSVILGRRVL
jgi:hypothetical protein